MDIASIGSSREARQKSANHHYIAGLYENPRAPRLHGKFVVCDTFDGRVALDDLTGEPLAFSSPSAARHKADELNGAAFMRAQRSA
ncbi:MAG: hypothetical protein ACK4NA_12695 [Alphaproteobacteria bacterium]